MKRPDRDTLTIWYCLIALGVVTSLSLARFAGVRFFYSVWITVPAFLATGLLGLRWWLKSVDKSIAKATTPLQVRQAPGIGELKQLPDYWAVELEVAEGTGVVANLYVSIAADGRGPSERQLGLVRTLMEKYAQLKPVLLESLRTRTEPDESANILEQINCAEVSCNICPDGDREDLDVTFPVKDGSDMVYAVCLKDWQVVDVYGAD
jgi:hypothetical protein